MLPLWFYDGHGRRILYEVDETGLEPSLIASYTYGINLIARLEGISDSTAYYLYNGHGDVTGLVDIDGVLIGSFDYEAFGDVLEDVGIGETPFKYAGEYFDKETGLYLMGAKYYASRMGRWITEDPYKGSVDDPLSLNLYVFVRNSPLIYVDPSGFAERRSDDEERYFIESANSLGLLGLKAKQVGYGVGKGIWKFVNLPGDICDLFVDIVFDLFSPIEIANQTQAIYPYMTRWEAIQRGYSEYGLGLLGSVLGASPKTLWIWSETLVSSEHGTEEKAEAITDIAIILLIEGLQGGLYENTTPGSLVEYSNNSYLGPKWFTPGIIEGTSKTNGKLKMDLQFFAKKDLKMVNDAANQVGVDRKLFGEYIHEVKADLGMKANENFTYKELIDLAKELKNILKE